MTMRSCGGCLVIVFLTILLWAVGATCFASLAHAQNFRWPDAARLTTLAHTYAIDRPAVFAIAWEESAANDTNPLLRGHHCWWTARADSIPRWANVNGHEHAWTDTHGALHLTHHEPNCEVGRFQIKPSTAHGRCPGVDVLTYEGNITCFAMMFAEDTKAQGRLFAIKKQNGKGDKADAYLKRVLYTIGWLTETEDP